MAGIFGRRPGDPDQPTNQDQNPPPPPPNTSPIGADGRPAQLPGPLQDGPGGNSNAGYNARTGIADFHGDDMGTNGTTGGQVTDQYAWGGTSGRVVRGPDGKLMVDTSQSGRGRDVNRLRGIADDAEGRAAPTMDYSKGDVDRAQAGATRGQQLASNKMLASAAHGDAPSGAVIRGQGATDDSFASQLGAQAGAKGGAVNQAAANQAGADAASAHQVGTAGALAGARSGELTSARGAYSTGANTMRMGDYAQQTSDQRRNAAQLANEMGQRDLNQHRRLGYEGLGIDVNEGAMNAGLNEGDRQAGITQTSIAQGTKNADTQAQMYAGGIQGAGSAFKFGEDTAKANDKKDRDNG